MYLNNLSMPMTKRLKNSLCLQGSFSSNLSWVSHKAKSKTKPMYYDIIWECNPRDWRVRERETKGEETEAGSKERKTNNLVLLNCIKYS